VSESLGAGMGSVSGEIVEATEEYFVFQDEIGIMYSVNLSEIAESSNSVYEVGDFVTVYFKGDILEIDPAEFQEIVRVEKREE